MIIIETQDWLARLLWKRMLTNNSSWNIAVVINCALI